MKRLMLITMVLLMLITMVGCKQIKEEEKTEDEVIIELKDSHYEEYND